MKLTLDWRDDDRIVVSVQEKNDFLWDKARKIFPDAAFLDADAFLVLFNELLAKWKSLLNCLRAYNVEFCVSDRLKQDVARFNENQNVNRNYSREILLDRLEKAGFKRTLTDFQVENVCRLTRKNQGATFSVPGAGKTTEALAFFYSTAEATDKLLVIAPLNAFGAWDEQLVACTEKKDISFVRLKGGPENVERLLRENHRFLLTNYEMLRSEAPFKKIQEYLCRNHDSVYVFLDESHKIKNDRTALARAIQRMQCYPKAKLIMSGTPMPQSAKDLIPQYNFLFPADQVVEQNVIEKFQNIYVRTTAKRLGITPIKWRCKRIELDEIELRLYQQMRSLSQAAIGREYSFDAKFLRKLGKSVMRLMAFVSNPSLVANHFAAVSPELRRYLCTKDGRKIEYVCYRARQLASQHKKVLIWSSFVKNVELISHRLQDLGADYIHGGVKAGDVNDPTSREGKIHRFHEQGGEHMVLVANPAAASEGISLHKACQYAIYLDRTFNAAHFLQSQDRIHRLGLPPNSEPEIELVICPNTIDELVDERLKRKIEAMAVALNDASIVPSDPLQLYDEENEDGLEVDSTDSGISPEDVKSILAHLRAI